MKVIQPDTFTREYHCKQRRKNVIYYRAFLSTNAAKIWRCRVFIAAIAKSNRIITKMNNFKKKKSFYQYRHLSKHQKFPHIFTMACDVHSKYWSDHKQWFRTSKKSITYPSKF